VIPQVNTKGPVTSGSRVSPYPLPEHANRKYRRRIPMNRNENTHRVPSRRSRKSVSPATRVRARYDVIETRGTIVYQRIEEAQWLLAFPDQVIVQKGDDTGRGLSRLG
jgi:hypothetical protein